MIRSALCIPRALENVFAHARYHKERLQNGIAIAVSGGADSMALACLAKHHFQPSDGTHTRLIALVVDHGLRQESSAEAAVVKDYVENKIGIQTNILRAVDLEKSINRSRSNLETEARGARYRLLGHACLQRRIQHLLLAHHADDDYEGILMRQAVVSGAFNLSLKAELPIPVQTAADRQVYGLRLSGTPTSLVNPQDLPGYGGLSGVDAGGISILRPLLETHKQELVDLLTTNDIPWVEDPSNTDTSLTVRNAVRSLSQADLPDAMQKTTVLANARAAQDRQEQYNDCARVCFDKCQIKFDPILGKLYAFLPSWRVITEASSHANLKNTRLVAAIMLRSLADLVDCADTSNLRDFDPFVDRVYPETGHSSGFNDGSWSSDFSSQAGSVQIRSLPIKSSLSWPSIPRGEAAQWQADSFLVFERVKPRRNHKTLGEVNFVIPPATAARFDADELRRLKSLETEQPTDSFSEPQSRSSADARLSVEEDATQSVFQHYNFDNRFWISVHNRSRYNLILKPATQPELVQLQAEVSQGCTFLHNVSGEPLISPIDGQQPELKMLCGISPHLVPDAVIPALYGHLQSTYDYDSEPKLLAFPTLGLRIARKYKLGRREKITATNWFDEVTWTARYKHIELFGHRLKDVLVAYDAPLSRYAWHHILQSRSATLSATQQSSLRFLRQVEQSTNTLRTLGEPARSNNLLTGKAVDRQIRLLKHERLISVEAAFWSGQYPQADMALTSRTMIDESYADNPIIDMDINADPDHVTYSRDRLVADPYCWDTLTIDEAAQYMPPKWWPKNVTDMMTELEPTVSGSAEVEIVSSGNRLLRRLSEIIGVEPRFSAKGRNLNLKMDELKALALSGSDNYYRQRARVKHNRSPAMAPPIKSKALDRATALPPVEPQHATEDLHALMSSIPSNKKHANRANKPSSWVGGTSDSVPAPGLETNREPRQAIHSEDHRETTIDGGQAANALSADDLGLDDLNDPQAVREALLKAAVWPAQELDISTDSPKESLFEMPPFISGELQPREDTPASFTFDLDELDNKLSTASDGTPIDDVNARLKDALSLASKLDIGARSDSVGSKMSIAQRDALYKKFQLDLDILITKLFKDLDSPHFKGTIFDIEQLSQRLARQEAELKASG